MASINQVARRILTNTDTVATMKLQKLAFYAQAHSLVTRQEPLFSEDFQAWRGGPVVSELYQLHRGKFLVSEEEIDDDDTVLTSDEQQVIDQICEKLGSFSGNELSRRTHREAPWTDAREGLSPEDVSQNVISKDAIFKYYSSHPVLQS